MEVFECQNQFSTVELGAFLTKFEGSSEVKEEFATYHEIHDQIEFDIGLERIVKSNYEGMSHCFKNVSFVLGVQLLIAFLHHIFPKNFHGIESFVSFGLD